MKVRIQADIPATLRDALWAYKRARHAATGEKVCLRTVAGLFMLQGQEAMKVEQDQFAELAAAKVQAAMSANNLVD